MMEAVCRFQTIITLEKITEISFYFLETSSSAIASLFIAAVALIPWGNN